MRKDPADADQGVSLLQELIRKTVHLGGLIVPIAYANLAVTREGMSLLLAVGTLLIVVGDLSRYFRWWPWRFLGEPILGRVIRPHEQVRMLSGASWMAVGMLLAVVLYSRNIAIAAMVFCVVGDILAAVVGRLVGGKRIWGRKSWAGSTAFLTGCLAIGLVLPGSSYELIVIGAITATFAELAPIPFDDNLSIPVLSGGAMTLGTILLRFF